MDRNTLKNISQALYPSLNEELNDLGIAIPIDQGIDIKRKILSFSQRYDVTCVFKESAVTIRQVPRDLRHPS